MTTPMPAPATANHSGIASGSRNPTSQPPAATIGAHRKPSNPYATTIAACSSGDLRSTREVGAHRQHGLIDDADLAELGAEPGVEAVSRDGFDVRYWLAEPVERPLSARALQGATRPHQPEPTASECTSDHDPGERAHLCAPPSRRGIARQASPGPCGASTRSPRPSRERPLRGRPGRARSRMARGSAWRTRQAVRRTWPR